MTDQQLETIRRELLEAGMACVYTDELIAEVRRLRELAIEMHGTICCEFCGFTHSNSCEERRKALDLP